MSCSDEKIYDVERIIKDRTIKGKKQYLIKWVGYPESECTWEDENNMFCDDMVREYEENKRKKKVPEKKRPEKMFRLQVTNEWDDIIKKVVSVSRSNSGSLEVEYVTVDGKKGVCNAAEIHSKAPIRLIEFYEANLSFPE
ncbi:HP1 [Enterospora canceri]|uniref:HP1 n=1 Tax=Enterospora canceri TaxID=1081671 RepID=A0A1Y1S7L5_9MICR|nr:HP1 [Enterospora canceri]